MECGGDMQVYIEPLFNKPDLYIFGAGHVGKALSHLAIDMGFQITVIDERPDIFNSFDKSKIKTYNGAFTEFIENSIFSNNTYIVVMTHEHKYDFDVLSKVCKKTHLYLGMIGSKTKVKQARDKLIDQKIIDIEIINQIDMPIGIPINCETPQEIAVSIVAKLIDVKNRK